MAASYVTNIVINSGSDFSQTFNLENSLNSPLDLTGYSAFSALKKSPLSLNKAANFTVSFPNRLFGSLTISLASSITSTLKPGRYSYDVLLIDKNSVKTRVVEGSAIITAGVTTA